MGRSELRVIPIPVAGEIKAGDVLMEKLLESLSRNRLSLAEGDILVVKHKIDARVSELAIRESKTVIRRKNGILITQTRHGFICANSGVDVSNVDGGKNALLLPEDSDRSAARLHREIRKHLKIVVPVIISDSFGRPWREGLTEVAIGIAGMKALHDDRGRRDPHGYKLRVSLDAVADELACAAGLLSGKLTRIPFVIIRAFRSQPGRASTTPTSSASTRSRKKRAKLGN